MIRSKDVTDVERSRVKAFIPLFILGMLFWAIQEQGSKRIKHLWFRTF